MTFKFSSVPLHASNNSSPNIQLGNTAGGNDFVQTLTRYACKESYYLCQSGHRNCHVKDCANDFVALWVTKSYNGEAVENVWGSLAT
ncbi:hypothetical protein BT96DRAFT_1020304 [Gymnopus androsaceus JB14]|uniref:Uncharacterized protein n=1 Tax=Gymnopus androsaceus JB14 TaxID=1447944 RepID=A0A6A4HJQ0_9AGAR|nr:hypothetical protein BT96DRAFT_1020304 [Gymnopus androsaceus JB14]